MSNPSESEELIIYLLMRTDIEMPMGKMLAQSGHASMMAYRSASPDVQDQYVDDNQPKFSVKADAKIIEKASAHCSENNVPHFVVVDAARNVFTEPTVTCMGIGPVRKSELPRFIRSLRSYDVDPHKELADIKAELQRHAERYALLTQAMAHIRVEIDQKSVSPGNAMRQLGDYIDNTMETVTGI